MTDRPQIKMEIENRKSTVSVVGQYSAVGQALKELLAIRGLSVNDSSDKQNFFSNNQYLFQVGEFEKAEFFLEKAQKSGAKYYLVYNAAAKDKAGEKTLKIINQKILAKKGSGKIIQYSGFEGRELELAQQILTNCFRQTNQDAIILRGPREFFAKEEEQNLYEKTKPKKSFLKYLFVFLFGVFLLTLPLTFILTNLALGGWSLNQSYKAALNADFLKAKISARGAEENFKTGLLAIKLFRATLPTKDLNRVLEAGINLSLGAGYLAEAGEEGQKIGAAVFGQEQTDLNESLTKIKFSISAAEEELALVEAQTIDLPFLQNQIAKAASLRQKLVKVKSFLPNFPWILGFDRPRNYLVLLQNNFELRPGGGFIGALGFLTINEGKVEFKIEDIYAVDGQLTGHVEPPKAIRDYLGQPHWYLRDSNFDPDFSVNAQKALWFLEKELGVSLDGVISVDLSLFQKILQVTGPIDISDYQEKIDAENFFLKTQAHVNDNFFPGSTAKRDFLGAAGQALFNRLTSNNLSYLQLAQVISSAFDERHLMLFWKNPAAQEATRQQGWGGEGRDNAKCKMQNAKCVDDYLMVVEANLGVNKVNYFVKRKIKKEINLDQNSLISKLTINYENTSPAKVNFGGAYKNYLRVLTNKDWALESLLIDNQNLSLSKGIDQEEIRGKKSTGFLVEIPPLGKKEVALIYKKDRGFMDNKFVYNLLVQKQAGTDKDSLMIASNFGLSYNGDLLVDRMFQIRLK